jgi:hypothetical protein
VLLLRFCVLMFVISVFIGVLVHRGFDKVAVAGAQQRAKRKNETLHKESDRQAIADVVMMMMMMR